MELSAFRACLESSEAARGLLERWRLRDPERGWRNLSDLSSVLGREAVPILCQALDPILPRLADPDMALNGLERFLANPAGALQLAALLENRAQVLETLAGLLSNSQFFSDLLARHPEYTEMLRVPLRHSPSQEELESDLEAAVQSAFEHSAILREFRHFRQRQLLRIGTNDIIRERSLEEITHDISRVADAALEVALRTAMNRVAGRFGSPYTARGQEARCAIMAFGKLGGEELNYSSDIDLMFVYDEEGSSRNPRSPASISNEEFFGRVVSEVVRLLSSHTDDGQAYRIDLRLRPEGDRGPLARSFDSTLSYYDTLGRTWERQALIKLRPVAGDRQLGDSFFRAIEPFVYRKYLSFGEINEIKAPKRKIEQKTGRAGETDTDVKTGLGGIRDIEFTIQFLQLLNGGELPQVRQRNTLQAMQTLGPSTRTWTVCPINLR